MDGQFPNRLLLLLQYYRRLLLTSNPPTRFLSEPRISQESACRHPDPASYSDKIVFASNMRGSIFIQVLFVRKSPSFHIQYFLYLFIWYLKYNIYEIFPKTFASHLHLYIVWIYTVYKDTVTTGGPFTLHVLRFFLFSFPGIFSAIWSHILNTCFTISVYP